MPFHSVDESHCGNHGSHTPNIQVDVVMADETPKDQSTLKDQGALAYQRTFEDQRTLEDPAGSCQLMASKQMVLVDRSADQLLFGGCRFGGRPRGRQAVQVMPVLKWMATSNSGSVASLTSSCPEDLQYP